MKFKFPFSKEQKIKCSLVVDIGTEAIKALVFKKEGRRIIILGSSLQYFDKFGVFDGVSFETDIIKGAISKAISEARSQVKAKIDSLFLGLPANIFQSTSFLQRFQRERKTRIDEKEEKQIHQKILSETEKKILKIAQNNSGLLPQDIQFDLKFLDTKIDGYEVNQIVGFAGQDLEFKILASFLPKYYLKSINNIFSDLNFKPLKISNLAEGLHYLLGSKKDQGIFMDIGGEITQAFLVKEGRIYRIFNFEVGGSSFSKTLSRRFGLTEKAAREMKENYSKRHFSEESRKRIREVLVPSVQKWFLNLKDKLGGEKLLLPSKIFLFGGGSLLPEIQRILKRGRWTDLPFVSEPAVKLILPKDLPNIDDKTYLVNNPQYIPSVLLCFS